jgi:hypothetical protein
MVRFFDASNHNLPAALPKKPNRRAPVIASSSRRSRA